MKHEQQKLAAEAARRTVSRIEIAGVRMRVTADPRTPELKDRYEQAVARRREPKPLAPTNVLRFGSAASK